MTDGVRIDGDRVLEVAGELRSDADGGFASAAARGAALHAYGVVFGAAVPGDVVREAREKYARALAYTDANLRAYRRMAALLAAQADQVVRELAAADQVSRQAQRRLADLLDGPLDGSPSGFSGSSSSGFSSSSFDGSFEGRAF